MTNLQFIFTFGHNTTKWSEDGGIFTWLQLLPCMKDTFFVCLLWNRLNFIFPPHLIKQKIKIILKCYAKQWGEAVTGHSLQLFELLLTPFLVTVFLQVHRDNELWYPWTKSQINPRKKTNYLTVSQEEVMDKVAEMYNTNNSFFCLCFCCQLTW